MGFFQRLNFPSWKALGSTLFPRIFFEWFSNQIYWLSFFCWLLLRRIWQIVIIHLVPDKRVHAYLTILPDFTCFSIYEDIRGYLLLVHWINDGQWGGHSMVCPSRRRRQRPSLIFCLLVRDNVKFRRKSRLLLVYLLLIPRCCAQHLQRLFRQRWRRLFFFLIVFALNTAGTHPGICAFRGLIVVVETD